MAPPDPAHIIDEIVDRSNSNRSRSRWHGRTPTQEGKVTDSPREVCVSLPRELIASAIGPIVRNRPGISYRDAFGVISRCIARNSAWELWRAGRMIPLQITAHK